MKNACCALVVVVRMGLDAIFVLPFILAESRSTSAKSPDQFFSFHFPAYTHTHTHTHTHTQRERERERERESKSLMVWLFKLTLILANVLVFIQCKYTDRQTNEETGSPIITTAWCIYIYFLPILLFCLLDHGFLSIFREIRL